MPPLRRRRFSVASPIAVRIGRLELAQQGQKAHEAPVHVPVVRGDQLAVPDPQACSLLVPDLFAGQLPDQFLELLLVTLLLALTEGRGRKDSDTPRLRLCRLDFRGGKILDAHQEVAYLVDPYRHPALQVLDRLNHENAVGVDEDQALKTQE